MSCLVQKSRRTLALSVGRVVKRTHRISGFVLCVFCAGRLIVGVSALKAKNTKRAKEPKKTGKHVVDVE